jgi:hypothetical protein
MKVTIFCDVTPCSLVDVYRNLRRMRSLSFSVKELEAARSSETSANVSQSTGRQSQKTVILKLRISYGNLPMLYEITTPLLKKKSISQWM